MSRLVLHRNSITKQGIFGQLYLVDNDSLFPLCVTLEPSPNYYLFGCSSKTFFPSVEPALYALNVTFSPRFRKKLPLLSVNGRIGIRIHAGNTQDDTSGCILVGTSIVGFTLRASQLALNHVLSVIKAYKVDSIEIISNVSL